MINVPSIKMVLSGFAVILLYGSSAVSGADSREEMEAFLKAPGAVEVFNSTRGRKAASSDSQESPLVKQAQAFALYLDPPPKPEAKRSPRTEDIESLPPRPAVVNAKFDLSGTCYYAQNPQMSLALIKETGKGLHWVRQGSSIGRLVIEGIEDGQVTVRDGQRTFTLTIQRPEKKSLVKWSSAEPGAEEAVAEPLPKKVEKVAKIEAAPEVSAEETALLEKFFAEMQALESKEGDSEQLREEGVAKMDQLLAELESFRISSQEANELDSLGRELQKGQQQLGQRQEVNSPKKSPKIEKPSSSDK